MGVGLVPAGLYGQIRDPDMIDRCVSPVKSSWRNWSNWCFKAKKDSRLPTLSSVLSCRSLCALCQPQ